MFASKLGDDIELIHLLIFHLVQGSGVISRIILIPGSMDDAICILYSREEVV